MPKVAESLVVPVVLPIWSLICAVVIGAFGFGINYNQLSSLIEKQAKVDVMFERQIAQQESLRYLSTTVQQIESRVTVLEKRGK